MNNECWRNISEYTKYQVSNIGRVRNSMTGRILKTIVTDGGYYTVLLYKCKTATRFRVHRLVAQEFIDNPDGKPFVDHVNHNVTDNTVLNLRWVSISENNMNQTKRLNTSSKHKGVSFNKQLHKWHAYANIDGTRKHLGYFSSEKEAGAKYNEYALEHFGEYALLNKISSDETNSETEDVDDDETHTDSEV